MNFNNFFNPDNMFFRFMGRLSDLMILNFMWILCSIPIITIGASTTALYNTTLKMVNENEGYLLKSFFKSFKDNFKKATIVWLAIIISFIVLAVNLIFWIQFRSLAGYVSISIVMFLSLLFLLTNNYIFPLISSFNLSIKNSVIKSFVLALKYLPYSVLLLAISIIEIVVTIMSPIAIIFMIILGFSFCAFINSYLLKKVFSKSAVYLENLL